MGGKDPDSRRSFPWDENQWNKKLLAWFKQCVALRNAHPALRTGDFKVLYAEGDVIAYARTLGEEVFIVLLNAGHSSVMLDIAVEAALSGTYQACIGGIGQFTVADGKMSAISLPQRYGLVLKRQ